MAGSRRIPIALKLLAVYLVPTVITFAGFSWLVHVSASRSLEDELGRRLVGVAATAATLIDPDELSLLQPGDEQTRTYRNLKRRLDELVAASGMSRIYVFDGDDQSLCDTASTPIGERYYALSRSATELRLARNGTPNASVLFRGQDGQSYKSAFAGLHDSEGRDRWVIGVDGAASMYAQLASLRSTLLFATAAGVGLVILLSFVAARLLVAPIGQLARAAARIGRGDLEHPIARASRDEIGTVAETMEHMREQLRSRDERMQMMLAGIAHEVRNPLGGLQLYAGLLRDEIPPEREDLVGHAKKVERELDHLKQIVSDFLEYARRPRPERTRVDARELCEEIGELTRSDAAAKQVVVEVEVPAGLVLHADAGQLRRALLNLTQNAVQASPAAGKVSLVATTVGDSVQVRVIDRGPGVTDEAAQKIWAPFFTTKQKGTGLGLAFVREIALDHGGTAELEATRGGGATFVLSLPVR
jgi:signal transduction histidine kinase